MLVLRAKYNLTCPGQLPSLRPSAKETEGDGILSILVSQRQSQLQEGVDFLEWLKLIAAGQQEAAGGKRISEAEP